MKAFVLDCAGEGLIEVLAKDPSFDVIGAIVFSEQEKHNCLKLGIQEVHTLQEMDFISGFLDYLDFDVIEEFRATQRKVEFGMMRSLKSNMLIANKYYNALAYFNWFFSRFEIGCIYVSGIPHGYIPETILLDMGKKLAIPSYCIFPVTSRYSSLLRYDQMRNIPIAKSIDSEYFSKQIFDASKQSHDAKNHQSIKGALKKMIYMGGGQMMIDVFSCLKRRSLRIHVGFYKNMRLTEKLYSYYRLKEMKRFYQRHAIQMDEKQKYIFYAIHFEPEASTGVIAEMQNQLTIIQLISSALPEGWLLYIKDHPHQYDINNTLDHYYLTNIEFFKDMSFYQEVIKLDNVRLIDLQTPSQRLIKHAQATATINGSIILESLLCSKHCITFDHQIMAITQRAFNLIHPFRDLATLRAFIASLTGNPPAPISPEALQDLARYYFDHRASDKHNNIIQSMHQDLLQHKASRCGI